MKKSKTGLQMTEVVCGPKTRCYALQHVLDLKGLKAHLLFDPKTGKSRTGIGLKVETKVKGKKRLETATFFLAFCPWCGGAIQ